MERSDPPFSVWAEIVLPGHSNYFECLLKSTSKSTTAILFCSWLHQFCSVDFYFPLHFQQAHWPSFVIAIESSGFFITIQSGVVHLLFFLLDHSNPYSDTFLFIAWLSKSVNQFADFSKLVLLFAATLPSFSSHSESWPFCLSH